MANITVVSNLQFETNLLRFLIAFILCDTVVSNLQFETKLLRFLIAFILCDSSRLKIAEKKISDCAALNLKLLVSHQHSSLHLSTVLEYKM